MPARPAIPVSIWALAAAIVAERVVLRLGVRVSGLGDAVWCVVAACAGAGVLAWASRHRQNIRSGNLPIVSLVFVSASVAALLAGISCERVERLADELSTSAVSTWEFVCEGDMSPSETGWFGRARVLGGGQSRGEVWLTSPEELEAGTRLRCVGRFSQNADDEWGVTSRMQGVSGRVRVVHVMSAVPEDSALSSLLGLRRAVLASFDPYSSDARALLAGGVCGYRAAIKGRGLDDAFATCGVAHLVAVSGAHLAILTSLIARLLKTARLGPRVRGVITLGIGALFVLFCGAPASAVRAWGMCSVASLGGLAGRRTHALSSVGIASLVMALVEPTVSGQLGFILSVLSVTGICLFGSYARHVLAVVARLRLPPRFRRRAPRTAACLKRLYTKGLDVLAVSVVAQLSTLPVTAATFGGASLVAPLANLALSPLFTLVVSLGLVSASLSGAPVLQTPVLALADGAGAAFCQVLRDVAGLPLSYVSWTPPEPVALIILCAAAAALLVFWPPPRRAHVAVVLLACGVSFLVGVFCLRMLQPARVCVMDVGQGDAILVADGASAILVDTGPEGVVVDALARQGIVHLDALVLTHLHDDHVGGVGDLVGRVRCEKVIVARGVSGHMSDALLADVHALTGADPVEVGYGDVLRVGSFSLRVISPPDEVTGEENADSLELALDFERDGSTLTGLLTGDAEKSETGACLARGDVGDIDFLKVGHHGSEISVSSEEAAALDAELAVASAGAGNEYGHPAPACVDALEGAGSTFLCTIEYGDVTVRPSRDGPSVSVSKGRIPNAA